MILDRDKAVVVVVDVQEGFRPVVRDFDAVAANVAKLVQGAQVLEVPVFVSEQYPQGLGRTVPEVAQHLDGVEPVEKVVFSAAEELALALGGCGSSAPAPSMACPPPLTVQDAGRITHFKDGPGRDPRRRARTRGPVAGIDGQRRTVATGGLTGALSAAVRRHPPAGGAGSGARRRVVLTLGRCREGR